MALHRAARRGQAEAGLELRAEALHKKQLNPEKRGYKRRFFKKHRFFIGFLKNPEKRGSINVLEGRLWDDS